MMRGTEKKQKDLHMLLKMLPDNMVGIEIGSFAGESAAIFAASGKFKKLHCVDPWFSDYYKNNQIPVAEQSFDKVAAQFPDIIVKNKMTSDDFFKSTLLKPDIIYIDGNHDYAFVKRDLVNSVALLKKAKGKMILAGHDYGFHGSPGVKPAVKEVVEYPDAKFCYYSWVKFL